jgi:phosphoenolpyruvate-protein kinase (PTS system EI component)
MGELQLTGTPASPGVVLGAAWRLADEVSAGGPVPPARREGERDRALGALAEAVDSLVAVAAGLAPEEAEIVETGALMAQDPALTAAVEQAVMRDGMTAVEAIHCATSEHADVIAAIGDEHLAARADDVRSLGRRAAALAAGACTERPVGDDVILLADVLGPADVAELATVVGVALVGGGPTAHAAIVARSLGIPMVTALGQAVLEIADGAPLVLDGGRGSLTVSPSEAHASAAVVDMDARRATTARAHELREQPAVTRDGVRVGVLANVAGAAELAVGLRDGAEGIGLLRTELGFLEAMRWPSEQEHTDLLTPILDDLDGHPAVVRVLDFGADKAPPFLRGDSRRGIELLLAHPYEFVCQLRALMLAARDRDVRILLPMVDTAQQVEAVRALLEQIARELGVTGLPPLGAMIETAEAVSGAQAIAAGSDFLSIGTNDLTASLLGADRFAVNAVRAHHPRVLRAIARSVAAAGAAGVPIEVCGEAASDPIVLPLLVGLGIDEVSVGAARVGEVREWIRRLDAAEVRGLARSAQTMDSAAEVESAVSGCVPVQRRETPG